MRARWVLYAQLVLAALLAVAIITGIGQEQICEATGGGWLDWEEIWASLAEKNSFWGEREGAGADAQNYCLWAWAER